jgi:hypothetical protein
MPRAQWIPCVAVACALAACQGSDDTPESPAPGSSPTSPASGDAASCECGPLPAPTGRTRTVSSTGELVAAVAAANAEGHTTILLRDGTYELDSMLWIEGRGLTFRSLSDDRNAVVIRGHGMHGDVSHVFNVVGSDFTLAHVTVGWVANHAVQIHSSSDDARIHDVRFVDTGEQMLKVSFVQGNPESAERGEVSCSLFEYSAGVGPQYYIGGIDAHQAHDWVVRGNRFRGIRSPEGNLAEHAVHFWSSSRNTLVERNVITRCDRGIGLGLGDRGHSRGLVRNNFVHATRDVGIGLESAEGARVLHNTVVAQSYPNAIELRFAATRNVEVAANLTIGAIALRDGASGQRADNVTGADVSWFADPSTADFHLTRDVQGVVDQVAVRDDVPDDIDCEARPRNGAADVGADEL